MLPIQASAPQKGCQMVPINILARVFTIRVAGEQGSAFTIEVDKRQYLVTARHLFDSGPTPKEIEINRNSSWDSTPFTRIPVEPPTIDIAVIALSNPLSPAMPTVFEFKNTFLSQSIFFLGYPFGFSMNGAALNNGYPLPLVKHGIISYLPLGKKGPFYIDGINNPGFSGGPVVRIAENQSPAIIGIISGYESTQEPVLGDNGARTKLSVQTNTGLIVAYSIEYALDAIARNPIGPIIHE